MASGKRVTAGDVEGAFLTVHTATPVAMLATIVAVAIGVARRHSLDRTAAGSARVPPTTVEIAGSSTTNLIVERSAMRRRGSFSRQRRTITRIAAGTLCGRAFQSGSSRRT